MDEHAKKTLKVAMKALGWAALSIAVYTSVLMLLLRPPECLWQTLYVLTGNGFSSKTPLVLILIAAVVCLATVRLWPVRTCVKMTLTVSLLAFSSAFVTVYIMAYMLRDFHW